MRMVGQPWKPQNDLFTKFVTMFRLTIEQLSLPQHHKMIIKLLIVHKSKAFLD
jgi:hypothetical protein